MQLISRYKLIFAGRVEEELSNVPLLETYRQQFY